MPDADDDIPTLPTLEQMAHVFALPDRVDEPPRKHHERSHALTVWKYLIDADDSQSIAMPSGAEILTVQVQGGIPFLWALVDPRRPLEHVLVQIVGTGHPFDPMGEYVGTYQIDGGTLVFHVFASRTR
jgi:hypothetical protein